MLLRRRKTDLSDRTVPPICHHIGDANTRRSTTGTIPRHSPFGSDPDISLSILKDILDRIVRQPISLQQILEHQSVIPADSPSRCPKPEMSFPILKSTHHYVIYQTILLGKGDKCRARFS